MELLAIQAKMLSWITEIGYRYEIYRKTHRIAVDRLGRAQRMFSGAVNSVWGFGQRSGRVVWRGGGFGAGCSEIQVL